MLRPPYQRYQRLYTYHFDRTDMPEPDDPDLIGVWEEGSTTIYFFHHDRQAAMEELGRRTGARLIYAAAVDYQDWEAGVEPTPFTAGGLRIAPVWDAAGADLALDPSVVFGSGFHPSTRLCIEALALAVDTFQPASMADLGTGTGVLALCGARLGIERVTAVDANRLACRVAAANVRRNGLADRITVERCDLLHAYPAAGADLLVANLHRELLEHLFARPEFVGHKYFILAGFRVGQEEALLAALPAADIAFVDRWRSDDWCLWILRHRSQQLTGQSP